MDYNLILHRLSQSKFRSSFKLKDNDKEYVQQKGIDTINRHAKEILEKRIKIKPKNDERQTPFKGHPVFIAQHATATCCRKCLEKWHKIPRDKVLDEKEVEYFAGLITEWISRQVKN